MKLTNVERLPCGCVIGDHGDAFIIQPCSLLCENYLYAMAEAKRQMKPTQWMKGKAEPDG